MSDEKPQELKVEPYNLFCMINSLFITVDLYSEKNIGQFITIVDKSIEKFPQQKHKDLFKEISSDLSEWRKNLIEKKPNPHVLLVIDKTIYRPLFKMMKRLYFSEFIVPSTILSDNSYIGSLYKATIYDDLKFFSYIVQENYYRISAVIEDTQLSTLNKIPVIINLIQKNPIILESSILAEEFKANRFVNIKGTERKAISITSTLSKICLTNFFSAKLLWCIIFILVGVIIYMKF